MKEKKQVIIIFDVGKTNKKFFIFDEQYNIVLERTQSFEEITDEDGFPCDDILRLSLWVKDCYNEAVNNTDYLVKGVNFSAYGASLVYIDAQGNTLTPLYNYLKPYPTGMDDFLYEQYGGKKHFSKQTASPTLGSLNSGLQLYRLQKEQPEVYSKTAYALHLPQYLSYLITGQCISDCTSVGCHTHLWNFEKNNYHPWIADTGIADKLAPLQHSWYVVKVNSPSGGIVAGTGLHDSSSALIPYLSHFREPFILISTGTWCISLNPFNNEPLTAEELEADCLCYLSFKGNPVKSSRLFSGQQHEHVTQQLSEHFGVDKTYYKQVTYNNTYAIAAEKINKDGVLFANRNLGDFENYEIAYHVFIHQLVSAQKKSTQFIAGKINPGRIIVDGGFSNNPLFMNFLALAFNDKEVYAAYVPQATAIGAALAIHNKWNTQPLPANLVQLKLYKSGEIKL